MTTYGTIPVSSSEGGSDRLKFISKAKERMRSSLSTTKPWKEMIANIHSLNFPSSFSEGISRIKKNYSYFLTNYAIIVFFVMFISLLWHPISLIVFIVMMLIWVFLYFLRDEPLVIFHRQIGDRVVFIVLSIVTLIALLLTRATWNILISLLVGVVVVGIHALLRRTDDLFVDEEEAFGKRPLNESVSS